MVKTTRLSKFKLTKFVKVLGLNINNELIVLNGKLSYSDQGLETKNLTEIDASNCIICPGFIDPQINGHDLCNFWDVPPPSFNEIDRLRLQLALRGVVGFCPTIITSSDEKIFNFIDHINSYIKQSGNSAGAKILGMHIEGVFISKYGVHESKYAKKDLTAKNIEPYIKENVIIFTLAPELDKTGEAIKLLQKNNILVSIGHTDATYKEGQIAVEEFGIRSVTHMFNAMRAIEGFSHRDNRTLNLDTINQKLANPTNIDPEKDGIMLYLLQNKNVLCMVIADGIHVHKEIVRLLKEHKKENSFALVSDSVSRDFFEKSKSKGVLGGGQILIDECVRNLIKWKITNIEEALLCASKPIRSHLNLPISSNISDIAAGKEANLVLWDIEKCSVKGTIIGENLF